MPERHVLKHQIPSLAKRGYDLSEYKPKIRFHPFSAWFFMDPFPFSEQLYQAQ
jgi:hypothetical protein